MKRFQNVYKQLLIVLLFPLAALGIFIQYKILPPQYFAGSAFITQNVNAGIGFTGLGDSYAFVSGVLSLVNIFGFREPFQWSVLLAVLINIMFLRLILKLPEINGFDFLFSAGSLFLLNCFVVNPSADALQLMLFMIMCAAVKTNRLVFIIPAFLALAALTLIMHPHFLPYHGGTYRSCAAIGPNLEINDLVYNENTIIGRIINFFVNVIRILFPAEILINADIFRFAVFAVQLLFSYRIIKITVLALKKGGRENIFSAIIVLMYFLTAVSSENDFFSMLRHEACAFPLLLPTENISNSN